MKTSELQGAALDWAVARCEGFTDYDHATETMLAPRKEYGRVNLDEYSYSTDWAEGGALIEKEKIELFIEDERWKAYSSNSLPQNFDGDTPLIAAMRCYVASKLGDDVEIPDELK